MEFLTELWSFLRHRKKFWLAPIIVILLAFSVLMLFAGGSAIAPFVYTLF
jgi:competence protein ComGC